MAQYVTKWEGGTTDVRYAWRSKVFVLPSKKTLTAAKVIADGYPLVVQFYTDGSLRLTRQVTSRDAFRLPSGFECEEIEARVVGTSRVNKVFLAESMDELRQT